MSFRAGNNVARMDLDADASCPPDMTMDQFVAYLQKLGNKIVRRDDKTRTVRIAHASHLVRWYACEKGCGFKDQVRSLVEAHEAGCHYGTVLR